MTRRAALLLATTSALGCSIVLDPDGLVFTEADAALLDDSETETASSSDVLGTDDTLEGLDTAGLGDSTLADLNPDTDEADLNPFDVSDPDGVIRVSGGSTRCEVAYRIAPALPLVDPCAKTCASKNDGWPLDLTFSGPGSSSATRSVEATQGVVATPASGMGAALATVLTFGEDNCGNADAVPDFTLLVNVKVDGVTTKASFDFDTTLDADCPAITCE